MTTFTKIASLVLVGSGIAGAGTIYALNSKTQTPSIEKIISESKRTLLDINKDGWDIKLHVYTTSQKKIKLAAEDVPSLKSWCTETLKKSFKNAEDENYLQAKEICTVPTNKEKLLKNNKQLAVSGDWQGIATKYRTEGKGDKVIPKFNGKTEPTSQEVESWCNENLKKEILEEKSNYELTLKWCTKTGQ